MHCIGFSKLSSCTLVLYSDKLNTSVNTAVPLLIITYNEGQTIVVCSKKKTYYLVSLTAVLVEVELEMEAGECIESKETVGSKVSMEAEGTVGLEGMAASAWLTPAGVKLSKESCLKYIENIGLL